ncbi:outer membrane lipid asymmetry maintenance protein MlaD [Minwuia sp.]|uniref:outer membrane lipid asymmetry maintenance protein MlaD n=1 Tax=Minwuia sp. TaxID=2493630 RepID=UPI003A932E6A
MANNVLETVIGAVVIAVAAIFVIFMYRTADIAPSDGYMLQAKFNSVNGVNTGADVRMSGIKIGSVVSTELEQPSLLAVVKMNIRDGVGIPDDSAVRVLADGLMGGTFLSVEPGGGIDNLKAGDQFQFAQGSVNLIDLVGQAIYSSGKSE